MIGKNFHHHFVPHIHEDGQQHHAHAVSVGSLFIYLQLILVFTAGLYLIRMRAPSILGKASFGPAQIIALTNAKRTQNNLQPLSENNLLDAAASSKAANMFSENYWSHNAPSGKTPWSFISATGYRYIYAGENLARDFDDAGSVVEAWMNSPSHRSNLLDGNFREIGVAVSYGSLTGREGTLVVQMFGNAISSVPTQQPLVQTSPNPTTQPSVSPIAQARPSSNSAVAQVLPSQAPSASIVAGEAQTTVLASRRFSIAKIASFIMVGFVFGLFLIEVVLTLKKSSLKFRPGLLAHLLILGFVLFALWYAAGGAIL